MPFVTLFHMPVSVENDSVVIHGEKHCAILHAEGRKGEFKIKTVEHLNHPLQ